MRPRRLQRVDVQLSNTFAMRTVGLCSSPRNSTPSESSSELSVLFRWTRWPGRSTSSGLTPLNRHELEVMNLCNNNRDMTLIYDDSHLDYLSVLLRRWCCVDFLSVLFRRWCVVGSLLLQKRESAYTEKPFITEKSLLYLHVFGRFFLVSSVVHFLELLLHPLLLLALFCK